ncbi:putative dj-1 family protein [Lasiodiplodia theobromae]|uniref:Dj-1 family protein n=1 Tax=Lasiodiplodia theobromae TaxID=45133 RepID=A0A5N5D7R6_9PEZI|nr:Dj-1 family protein [Lasiodiplodia theobromae]KAB2573615.1 hypothetical protein DBV05_g7693 [Lasiodiplodia theobromae]KAF4542038.1 Dj-1 family protein [Lasiodiplodia theobromae]KAF9628956.1 putative dj-1 family protein [Lasiodiplodia theobromae]
MSFNLSSPDRKIHAGVILTRGVTEMLDVAPFEFFAWVDKESLQKFKFPAAMVEEGMDIELHWVTEDGSPAPMRSGAEIKPTDSFASCPPLDIVLMGAHDVSYQTSETEKAFIRKAYEQCSAFLTVCGGVLALLEAGLLEGKTATGPRMILDMMRKNAPLVNWVDRRWVRDGKIWSSSTLLNGTDLMRAFAEETWGGRNGMVEAMLDAGHWPVRDVDFKDYQGQNYAVDSFE